MDALSSITRGRSEANFATRANPEPEAELTPPADDETPEAFNIVEIKDIWSDLEVCRASAAWNLRSYLKQTKPLGSHKDAPEPAARMWNSNRPCSLAHLPIVNILIIGHV